MLTTRQRNQIKLGIMALCVLIAVDLVLFGRRLERQADQKRTGGFDDIEQIEHWLTDAKSGDLQPFPEMPQDGATPGARRIEMANPTAHVSLAHYVEGYYRGIPGGLHQAIESARLSAESNPLPQFPPLVYDALDRQVAIRIRSFDQEWEDDPDKTLGFYRIGGDMFRGFRVEVHIKSGMATDEVKWCIEHELTHDWQHEFLFAPHPPFDAMGLREEYRTRILGDPEQHLARLAQCLGQQPATNLRRMQRRTCTVMEIDPRLAAFKRWWAANRGELLDTMEKARRAAQSPPPRPTPRDVGDFELLWRSYEDQPAVRQILLERLLQLVDCSQEAAPFA